MKIKETIERECCHIRKDLKCYQGTLASELESSKKDLYFCIHCGQMWLESTRMDAAGGHEPDFLKITNT